MCALGGRREILGTVGGGECDVAGYCLRHFGHTRGMIGLIGPRDSIALASHVAADLGIVDSVVPRAYDSPDEARGIARELDTVCAVLLFTGRVPYALASHDHPLRAILDFVPHGGIDLYRTLVLVLRDHGGRLPRLSIDTLERSVVEETYSDLDFAPAQHVLELDSKGPGEGPPRASDLTAFHRQLAEAGEVDLCLTCLGSVRDDLAKLGIPVVRVEHTRAALREALQRAMLTDRLARSEATQIAVALLEPAKATVRRGGTRYQRERSTLHDRERVLHLAERLQGTLADGPEGSFVIHTTRGSIEAELGRSRGRSESILGAGMSGSFTIGFGAGATVASAEEHARAAVDLARGSDAVHLVLDDGSTIRPSGHGDVASSVYRLRETDQRILARARELGIGPLTLTRLAEALRGIDPAAVTSRELARAYGVTPRSALRLLTALEAAGLATALGARVAPRAGRPQTVFRVNVEGLLPAR